MGNDRNRNKIKYGGRKLLKKDLATRLSQVISVDSNARITSGEENDGSSLRDVNKEIRKSDNDDGDDGKDEKKRDSSQNVTNNKNNKKILGDDKNVEEEGYENFSKGNGTTTISASTPKTLLVLPGRESALKELAVDPIISPEDRIDEIKPTSQRPKKNFSTISLPNYDELEVVKKEVVNAAQHLDAPAKPERTRHASTISLPGTQPVSRVPRVSEMKFCVFVF